MADIQVIKKLKDSGAEWIGSVPTDWAVEPLFRFFDISKDKIEDGVVDALSVGYMGVVPQLENAAKNNAGGERKHVRVGDIAINSRSDRMGAAGVASQEGGVSLVYHVLRPRHEVNGRFFHYMLRNVMFSQEFYRRGNGIVADLWSTKDSELKRIPVPVPPTETQKKIVDFLDRKTAQVDAVIEKKKRMIELLKEKRTSIITHAVTKGLDPNTTMKDSGVEWIGEIPEGWGVKRAMFVYNQVSRKPLENDEIITAFRDGQVTLRKNRREDGFTNAIVEAGYQRIEPGDLVIHGMDGFAGAIGVSDSAGKSSPVYSVCVPVRVNESAPRYHAYLLRHMASSNFILAQARGIRERSTEFRFKEFRKNHLLMPKYEEQVIIAEYLDIVSIKMNSCINQVQAQIERLTEYRASLIYHAVTGKMSV